MYTTDYNHNYIKHLTPKQTTIEHFNYKDSKSDTNSSNNYIYLGIGGFCLIALIVFFYLKNNKN
jgi:hypothetical protein